MLSENISQGSRICIICKHEFKWAGVFKGEVSPKSIKDILGIEVLADISALKTGVYNNGKTSGAELEVVAKCPECKVKNKFNAVHVLNHSQN
ncbi:hypothetical protein [Cytobacillus sp. FSL H8-0458]|uniref:hypothetical protein n=1 Tax=Cytobacillus sp. FSL H8-0458 TaxID=2975346 RepID=UPI0030F516FF